MSVKIKLEKKGKIINAFTGFSWTIFFFGFWVPAIRNKSKGLGLFLLFFIIKIFFFIVIIYQNIEILENLQKYGYFDISYSFLTPYLILFSTFLINIWLSYYYNKYHTTYLLIDGYYPLENDEFSKVILKDYTYLPYTKEELEDNDKMEKYKILSTFARKEERKKVKIFFIILIIFYVILFLLIYFNRRAHGF